MQSLEIQNTAELRRALALGITSIDFLTKELDVDAMPNELRTIYSNARLEMQLLHSALIIADNRKRAAGSGTRAS